MNYGRSQLEPALPELLVEVLELLLGAGLDVVLLGLDDRAVLACTPKTSNPS